MTAQANRYVQMLQQMIATIADETLAARAGMQSVSVVPESASAEPAKNPASPLVAEIGLIYPRAMKGKLAGNAGLTQVSWEGLWADALATGDFHSPRIHDAAGHWRGVYDVLAPYCLAMAMSIDPSAVPARMKTILEKWIGWHTVQLRQFAWPEGSLPAAMGTDLSVAAWRGVLAGAWSLSSGSGDGLLLAEQVVQAIASRQLKNGSLLHPSRGDNPEPMWYHELQILHALGTLRAILAEGGKPSAAQTAESAARRNAEYHQNETQPDHATTQPWGINVAMRDMETWPLADQLLQAAMFNQAGRVDGISLMLMADSLYWFDRR